MERNDTLSYQSKKRGDKAIAAMVVLWLWAIFDVVAGMVLVGAGLVTMIETDTGALNHWGLCPAGIGVVCVTWGMYVGRLATGFQRKEPHPARRAYRVCAVAAWVWAGLFILTLGCSVGLGMGWGGYELLWLIPLTAEAVVLLALGVTLWVLRQAMDQEEIQATGEAMREALGEV